MTSAPLRVLGAPLTATPSGFSSTTRLMKHAQPVQLLGSPSLPRPRFTHNDAFRCRTLIPACHRLRLLRPRLRTRLTLRRLTLLRNPQAFGGSGSHRPCATHSGILTSACSTSPCGLASLPTERSPTIPLSLSRRDGIHGFGTMLKPRYVVGAKILDQ